MLRANSASGFTLTETIMMLAILLVCAITTVEVISKFRSQSADLKKSTRSIESLGTALAPLTHSPRRWSEDFCNKRAAWEPVESPCDNLPETPNLVADQSIDYQPESLLLSGILGKDLRKYKNEIFRDLLCVDLIECKFVLSDAVLEMTFRYVYPSNEGHKRRSLKVRIGSRG